MRSKNSGAIEELVKQELRKQGLDWAQLASCCQQIILFGSWTSRTDAQPCDIDLLCIGKGQRLKRRCVDLVWFTPAGIRKASWLGSELANHVAHFGVWLHGEDDWSHRVYVSAEAIERKRYLIAGRQRGLARYWDSLRPEYREKQSRKLRRDIQRLELLTDSAPIEPGPLLDRRWKEEAGVATDRRLVFVQRYRHLLPDRQLRAIARLVDTAASR